ncbi:MAG: acetyltransferase [Cyclobacteriaceae bacterium]
MKKKIAIYGAGGFGRETALMISQINAVNSPWEIIGFFDDGIPKETTVDGLLVLGGMKELNSYQSDLSICLAVADPDIRRDLVSKISNNKIDFPVMIHPLANIGDVERNRFGKGSILTAGTILTTQISIGDFCIVNLSVTVGHDVNLGSYCTIMPGCNISGNVDIGEGSLLGTGTRIIQGIKIGDRCVVGAGAVVTKSFENNKKIMGVPARSI